MARRGLLTLNFGPMILAWGCYGIYNLHPIAPYESYNPLVLSPYVLIVAIFNSPFCIPILLAIVAALVLLVWMTQKPRFAALTAALSGGYRFVTILLLTLSVGFCLANRWRKEYPLSLSYMLVFAGIALALSLVLTCVTFHKRRILHGCAMLLAVALSATLILGVIPYAANKRAYFLPEKEDVVSVDLFIRSTETFETDQCCTDAVDLHALLLDLFEQGYLPDRSIRPYEEPTCLADVWGDQNVTFRYRLRNGETVYRSYGDLKDPAFDQFYIAYLKSDLYACALQQTEFNNPQIRYGSAGYDVSEAFVTELLRTYCEEMEAADESAFYEDYQTISFSGVYHGAENHILYVPISFTKTIGLMTSYTSSYRGR